MRERTWSTVTAHSGAAQTTSQALNLLYAGFQLQMPKDIQYAFNV